MRMIRMMMMMMMVMVMVMVMMMMVVMMVMVMVMVKVAYVYCHLLHGCMVAYVFCHNSLCLSSLPSGGRCPRDPLAALQQQLPTLLGSS